LHNFSTIVPDSPIDIDGSLSYKSRTISGTSPRDFPRWFVAPTRYWDETRVSVLTLGKTTIKPADGPRPDSTALGPLKVNQRKTSDPAPGACPTSEFGTSRVRFALNVSTG
jgi:hypothetical protein